MGEHDPSQPEAHASCHTCLCVWVASFVLMLRDARSWPERQVTLLRGVLTLSSMQTLLLAHLLFWPLFEDSLCGSPVHPHITPQEGVVSGRSILKGGPDIPPPTLQSHHHHVGPQVFGQPSQPVSCFSD